MRARILPVAVHIDVEEKKSLDQGSSRVETLDTSENLETFEQVTLETKIAEDVRVVKLFRLWEEAREILVENLEPSSVFQQMLAEDSIKKVWQDAAGSYWELEDQLREGWISDLHGMMAQFAQGPRRLSFIHVPDTDTIWFILEQYASICNNTGK